MIPNYNNPINYLTLSFSLRKYRRKIYIRFYRIKKKLIRIYKDEVAQKNLDFYALQILKISLLDLSPAKPILRSLYSQNPRGKKPRYPIAMLRSLIRMTLLRIPSIISWLSFPVSTIYSSPYRLTVSF